MSDRGNSRLSKSRMGARLERIKENPNGRNCQGGFQEVSIPVHSDNGGRNDHLKSDPKVDPNYTYTLAASGMAWEAHANPKRPGLSGFCYMSRSIGTTVTTYNPTGNAGWTDKEIMGRGIDGDSFAIQ